MSAELHNIATGDTWQYSNEQGAKKAATRLAARGYKRFILRDDAGNLHATRPGRRHCGSAGEKADALIWSPIREKDIARVLREAKAEPTRK
jgi:hypothetical protein